MARKEKFLEIGSPIKDFVSSLLEQVEVDVTEKGEIKLRKRR